MKTSKNKGTFLRLTEEELKILHILKQKYAINISALIRNTLNDTYKKMLINEKAC